MSDAPDCQFLIHKIVMVLGLLGACRREEMYKLKATDFEVTENGKKVIVAIRETKFDSSRIFVIEGAFLAVYQKYAKLRPETHHPNFLMKYKNGKCHNQVVGKEKIAAFPKEIAKFLKLPDAEKYTGQAFRRSSATIVPNAGASVYELQQHGGWKSETVAKGYVEESVGNKSRMAKLVQNQIANPLSAIVESSVAENLPPPPVATITSTVERTNERAF